MKRMTPATRLILDELTEKYSYFSKRNMLANDGSFYCLDRYLMEKLGISDNTIRRARIFLKEAGEINYAIGRHKGAPTRYWILSKGTKMEPSPDEAKQAKMASTQPSKDAKMEPFEPEVKEANLSAKEANLALEASQIGSLDNKLLIKIENKNMADLSSLSEEHKEGIRTFAKSYGIDRATNFLVDKGYDPTSVKQILEGAVISV